MATNLVMGLRNCTYHFGMWLLFFVSTLPISGGLPNGRFALSADWEALQKKMETLSKREADYKFLEAAQVFFVGFFPMWKNLLSLFFLGVGRFKGWKVWPMWKPVCLFWDRFEAEKVFILEINLEGCIKPIKPKKMVNWHFSRNHFGTLWKVQVLVFLSNGKITVGPL